MPTLEETKRWVRELHHGQTDKAGEPYIGHVLRVHQWLLRLFPDTTQAVEHAALLHDAMEDCSVTADELRQRGYTEETIAIVEAVTKRADKQQTYADRIDHLARFGELGALQVKIADLSDNSDPARLSRLPPEQADSLKNRYTSAIGRLETALAARGQARGQPRRGQPRGQMTEDHQ